MYAVSIAFFLYVFGYLLRSKRRKALKDKMRKNRGAKKTPQTDTHTIDIDAVRVGIDVVYSPGGHRSVSCYGGRPPQEDYQPPSLPPSPLACDGISATASSTDLDTTIGSDASLARNQRGGSTYNPIGHSSAGNRKSKKMKVSDNEHSHGSFFLRA